MDIFASVPSRSPSGMAGILYALQSLALGVLFTHPLRPQSVFVLDMRSHRAQRGAQSVDVRRSCAARLLKSPESRVIADIVRNREKQNLNQYFTTDSHRNTDRKNRGTEKKHLPRIGADVSGSEEWKSAVGQICASCAISQLIRLEESAKVSQPSGVGAGRSLKI